MKLRRSILGAGVVLVTAIGVVLTWIAINGVPETSQVVVSETSCETDDACVRFPTITGNSLSGQAYTLPEDFTAALNIVVVPFDRDQQVNAETWLPLAQTLTEKYPTLNFYNVPVFPDLSDALRLVIQSGMNIAIRDAEIRDRTILVYLEDRDAFLTAMQIPDVEQIQVFLLNDAGDVLWRGRGEFTDEQGSDLEQALGQVAGST